MNLHYRMYVDRMHRKDVWKYTGHLHQNLLYFYVFRVIRQYMFSILPIILFYVPNIYHNITCYVILWGVFWDGLMKVEKGKFVGYRRVLDSGNCLFSQENLLSKGRCRECLLNIFGVRWFGIVQMALFTLIILFHLALFYRLDITYFLIWCDISLCICNRCNCDCIKQSKLFHFFHNIVCIPLILPLLLIYIIGYDHKNNIII
jgi:hypothetical protein